MLSAKNGRCLFPGRGAMCRPKGAFVCFNVFSFSLMGHCERNVACHSQRRSRSMALLSVVNSVAEDTPSQPLFVRTLVQTQIEEAQQYLTSSRTFTGMSLATLTKTGVVSVKERVIRARREKSMERKDTGVLILELPAKSKHSTWTTQTVQQLMLSEKNVPLLFVPSLDTGEQKKQDGAF